MKRNFFILLICLTVVGGFFVCPHLVGAAETVISQDTVWDSGGVVVFNDDDSLFVDRGATLTITNGTVLKMGKNAFIAVSGKLVIQGSAEKPVVITSIKDDSIGGDTNGDGSDSQPAPGDWWGINVSGPADLVGDAEVSIDFAQIKYGGDYQDNEIGVISVYQAKDFTISHSNILNNAGVIKVGTENFKINYSNIYNPDYCQSMGADLFCGTVLMNVGAGNLDVKNNYWGDGGGPTVNPYLGFHGTILSGAFDYQPFLTELWKPELPKPNPVILIPGILGSWNVSGKWELDPILHTYDNLWEAFKSAGYEEGKTLFAFPYQWRDSNVSNTDDLMRKIQEVKEISGSEKVDLVGHSMGGLLARSYIESTYYNNDVDKLVFIATPHKGASKAYLMWEGGKLGFGPQDQIEELIFELESYRNGHSNSFQYVRDDVPSVRDLLPTYDYLKDELDGNMRLYPDDYPRNNFLDLLNKPGNMVVLDKVNILNIIADDGKEDTLGYINIKNENFDDGRWEHGYPVGLEYKIGDGTVPQESNANIFNKNVVLHDANHNNSVTKSQDAVIYFLTGKTPTTEIIKNLFDKFFVVRIFSPADFLITAPDGKELGRVTAGQNINEIDNAFYFNENGMEFAVIPNPIDGEYKVNLIGTGDGVYRLSFGYINNNNVEAGRDFNGNIISDQGQEFKIDYVASDNSLSELKPQDNVPPDIHIITPTSSDKYFRPHKLKINYTARDYFSGLSTTTMYLNGQNITTTTVDLFDYPVGSYQLKIVSSDLAENTSSSTSDFAIITDFKNTVWDIETFYVKHLIDKEVKNKLLPPLEQLRIKLVAIDWSIDLAIKAKQKLEAGSYLKLIRQKLIKEADKAVNKLIQERRGVINNRLDNLDKQLVNLLRQNKINQGFYDIIKADSGYLRNNL